MALGVRVYVYGVLVELGGYLCVYRGFEDV